MKQEMIEKLHGYEEISKEIDVLRKYGTDYFEEKGQVQAFIRRLHPKTVEVVLHDIIIETSSTGTLRLCPVDTRLPPFQAGQYISVFVEIEGVRTCRPYSISSSPTEKGYYDITVRRVEEGLVSGYLLDEVRVGDRFTITGPQGTFCHNPVFHDRTMVFIAGGSGITPFISMIREIYSSGLDREIFLFHGSKTVDELICFDELKSYDTKSKNIHYFPVLEEPEDEFKGYSGFITAAIIKDALGSADNKTFYVCGPAGMYDFCLKELETFQLPRRKIRREVYGVPPRIWESNDWPPDVDKDKRVQIKVNGDVVSEAKSCETVLSVLEKSGVVVPCVCRSGECSMCRMKLVSGKVYQPPGTLLRKSDRQFGFIHSCVAYPLEDIEILL